MIKSVAIGLTVEKTLTCVDFEGVDLALMWAIHRVKDGEWTAWQVQVFDTPVRSPDGWEVLATPVAQSPNWGKIEF